MHYRPAFLAALLLLDVHAASAQQPSAGPVFTLEEVMIPMRDGAHLQTVIMRPAGRTEALPIMLSRTPYGVPAASPAAMPPALKELAADGYVFVIQNLRGRFKSEGTFLLSSQVDLTDPSPKNVNETTDAYDTIDWLVKHVANTTGKVGMYGVSYDGLTTRGRYLTSFATPHPLAPNKPTVWTIPLREHDHVFLKGHRIMVQVQSTWFPAIDRNPQKFVRSIYDAKASDYVKATQRVFGSPSLPSHIVLPVVH